MIEPLAPQRRRPDAVAVACWLLSVGLLAVSVVLVQADPAAGRGTPGFGDPAWWWAAALLTAQAVVLARGRPHPRGALVAVAAALPGLVVLGDAIGVGVLAVLVATYRAALARPARRLGPALLAAGALVATGVAIAEVRNGSGGWAALAAGLLQGVGAVGLPLALAAVVGARRDTIAALADTVAAQRREHDARVQVAVERERTAMARELHDIAAHHLSGIAVMTGAIGRQIDVDPDGAKRAVAQVREQSTAMLQDLRNLVVLLRDVDAPAGPAGTVRVETLAGIAELVASAQETGASVSLETSGRVAELAATGVVGPLAQLAAYRVVQEALANAARHAAGARCEVRVAARHEGTVEVTVRNGPPAAGGARDDHEPGFGLVGMRERAELTGATLRYGPTDDGGWEVALSVPAAGPTTTEGRDR